MRYNQSLRGGTVRKIRGADSPIESLLPLFGNGLTNAISVVGHSVLGAALVVSQFTP
jgi:hypothetical protein